MLLAKELHKYITSKIESVYDKQEASSIAFLLMDFWEISKQDYVLNNAVEYDKETLDQWIEKLLKNIPIQYVLNTAHFYGRDFYVDENVLIPRPETEELCRLIISNLKPQNLSAVRHSSNFKLQTSNFKLLDIGTGSGCIPITLKLEIPETEVHALDISEKALKVAQKNAKTLHANVSFIHADILNDKINLSGYDVVVSNPPYVSDNEKSKMKDNVLKNEPHLALFVKDKNPLIFYEKITSLCVTHSVKQLYFEINEKHGKEISEMMVTKGYSQVYIKQDLQGKDRVIYASL